MIPKQEILSAAAATNVLPSTVEKDYVLSWTLFSISKNPNLSAWVFKGGTCLKKCFFETYRFSEDLDFSAPTGAVYDAETIKNSLIEISKLLYAETGIEIRENTIEVKESFNKNQVKTFEAKFGYVGPLKYDVKALPRIKFDITADDINPAKVRHALIEKFKFKLLPAPSVSMILQRIDFEILKANWDQQLRHQLPVLPPVEDFYNDLSTELSWWIDAVATVSPLPRPAVGTDERL